MSFLSFRAQKRHSILEEAVTFTSDEPGMFPERTDLARTGKGLACRMPPVTGPDILPAPPRTASDPELTTAPPQLAPLKLLPFGGTARWRAAGGIKTHDGGHYKLLWRAQCQAEGNDEHCDSSFYFGGGGL